ncbi:MAG: hypothetical protein FWH41_06015 [Treponema sp.]|nr:hypothetical protein [Treponema sp.]MCL2139070.1 hypothetical protein [Treponema sp.]
MKLETSFCCNGVYGIVWFVVNFEIENCWLLFTGYYSTGYYSLDKQYFNWHNSQLVDCNVGNNN